MAVLQVPTARTFYFADTAGGNCIPDNDFADDELRDERTFVDAGACRPADGATVDAEGFSGKRVTTGGGGIARLDPAGRVQPSASWGCRIKQVDVGGMSRRR